MTTSITMLMISENKCYYIYLHSVYDMASYMNTIVTVTITNKSQSWQQKQQTIKLNKDI